MSDAEGAEPKPESPARNAGARKGLGWLGALFLLLIAGGASVGSAYYLFLPALEERLGGLDQRLGGLESTAVTDRDLRFDVNTLDTRIGRMEDRVERIENEVGAPRPANGAAQDPRIAGLLSRLDALENAAEAPAPAPDALEGSRVAELISRIDALESALPDDLDSRLGAAASRDEQEEILTRLSALETDNSDATLRRVAGILALTELSRAAASPQPFTAELEAAAATAPNDSAIRTLRRFSDEGAPTLSQLAAEFPTLAREALDAERTVEPNGFAVRMWNRLMTFISVRRVGNVEGNDSAARIARAEAALGNQDLGAAIAEVSALDGPAAEHLAPWLARAEARQTVDGAVAEVNSRIVQTLANP